MPFLRVWLYPVLQELVQGLPNTHAEVECFSANTNAGFVMMKLQEQQTQFIIRGMTLNPRLSSTGQNFNGRDVH